MKKKSVGCFIFFLAEKIAEKKTTACIILVPLQKKLFFFTPNVTSHKLNHFLRVVNLTVGLRKKKNKKLQQRQKPFAWLSTYSNSDTNTNTNYCYYYRYYNDDNSSINVNKLVTCNCSNVLTSTKI